MKHSRTLARSCTLEFALVIGAGLLLLLGICCIVASFMLSYSSVRGHLDSLAMDGHAEEFDERTYRKLIFALGSTGALILPASVLALLLRRQISCVSKEVIRHSAVELRDAASTYWVDADPRSYWFSLLVITGIALWVRLVFLQQPMRFDEARTFLNYSGKPIYITTSNYSLPNNHVLHSLLVKLSCAMFGADPWAIRMPALIAGVALVPLTFFAVAGIYGRDPALLAAGLVASSSTLIEYSTNARGYTLLCCLTMGTFGLIHELIQRNRTVLWGLFALCSSAGFYTNPVFLYPFCIAMAWAALSVASSDFSDKSGRYLLQATTATLATAILIGLLYLPIFLASGVSAVIRNKYVIPLPWEVFTAELPASFREVWSKWVRDLPEPLVVVLFAGFIVGCLAHRKISTRKVPLITPILLVCPVLLAFQRVVPFARVWLFLLPLFLSIASAGVTWVLTLIPTGPCSRQTLTTLLALSAAAVLGLIQVKAKSVLRSDDTGTLRCAREVAHDLAVSWSDGDGVYAPMEACIDYYLDRAGSPARCTRDRLSACRRIWIVTPSESGTRPPEIGRLLRSLGINQDRFTEPRVVLTCGDCTVFRVESVPNIR